MEVGPPVLRSVSCPGPNESETQPETSRTSRAISELALTVEIPFHPPGPRFKLLREGVVQVCRLNHTRTVISKILSSKFLRRWENHHLILGPSFIFSKTPTGFMEQPIPYSLVGDVYLVVRWDISQRYCLRLVIPEGSLLLQVNNRYTRDQWLHSIEWKRNLLRYRKLLTHTTRPEALLKELKGLVDLGTTTTLQDDGIHQAPLEVISEFLRTDYSWLSPSLREDIIAIIAPLLDRTNPTPEICDFLCLHCRACPRSTIVLDLYTPIVHRILKHNMDFGKYPKTRVLVQEYVRALSHHNGNVAAVHSFVSSAHGPSSTCPHPRVVHNLISVSLSAIYSLFEERKNQAYGECNDLNNASSDWEAAHDCFLAILDTISTFDDWRPTLAQVLQPIPFPDNALAYSPFTSQMKSVIRRIADDQRCDVHLMLLGIREEKEGWFHLYIPGSLACDDDGQLWSEMVNRLVSCCCRRKSFLRGLVKWLGPLMLRALREDRGCLRALCSMLELGVLNEGGDPQLQVVTTLQSTAPGREMYAELCQRQEHLRELQKKGGPKKLALPSRSTDSDVVKLLSCGSFGNLECLSLAFTQVTSACAEQLIKLPSLRYLNLWSTQFGDPGLQLISEHLSKLQVLNLCETPVTDKGLVTLSALKNLRKLNLNSTNLSAQTFESLKKTLPALQECDVRYTDAW